MGSAGSRRRRGTRGRLTTMLAVVTLVVATLSAAVPGAVHAAPPAWRYTMVAFSNDSARDMDVYQSADGTHYELLKKDAYRPPSGYVRDPSIFRHTDGQYYVTYTTGDGANLGFARSPDRIHWTPMANQPVPFCCAFLPGTGDGKGPVNPLGINGSAGFRDGPSLSPFTTKAWAPDWFVDGDRVSVVWSMSTGGGFVPYVMTALNSSLTQWSLPVPLNGIEADHIDTTVVKIGSTYHAFTKNETKKVIDHAVAPALGGPYTYVPAGDWGTLVEGPAVVQLPNGDWRIYLDAYTRGKLLYSDSHDGLKTWSPVQELLGLSGIARHVGVMREPA